jgi:hypothetical protein
MDDTIQSKGGQARAQTLTPERRREIAKMGAQARLERIRDPNLIPEASHQGKLRIGDVFLPVYVLKDGRRLIHKRGMAKALSLKSGGGNAFMKTMSRRGIGSAISPELRQTIENPTLFKPLGGDPGHGYEATTLIEICDMLIQARNDKKLDPSQDFLAVQAEIIVRATAKVGIIALVDEATGYIRDKRKEEYRELFNQFVQDEFRQWEQEFPRDFFDMIYKLYKLKKKDPKSFKHPSFFGGFIRKYVYWPLANSNGAILEELDKKNPAVYMNGGRRFKLFQFLSDEIGVPAFRQHLWKTVGIGLSVSDKKQFDKAFYRAFPGADPRRGGHQLSFFEDE